MKYYVCINNRLEPAPRIVKVNGRTYINPGHGIYAMAGIEAYTLAPPEPPPEIPGKVAVPDGYEVVDGKFHVKYRYEDKPAPAPRKWSSLAMKRVLEKAGKWDEVKTMLNTLNKYDDFVMADYIAEDDDDFLTARAAAENKYGAEAVQRIIDSIPQTAG